MAESYSVKAVLSAVDKNFSSTFSSAQKSISGIPDSVKKATGAISKIAAGIGVFKALSAGANLLSSSVSSAFSRQDTMEQFNRTITTITGNANAASGALEELKGITKGTAYGLDTAAKATQNFVTRGMSLEASTKSVRAWADAVAFYGKGSNDQLEMVSDAIGKMRTKGTVEMDQLNRLFDVGIDAVGMYAKAVGRDSASVQEDLSKGKIRADEFLSTVETAMMEGTNGVQKISGAAKEAGASWSGTFDNMRAAVTRGTLSIINAVDEMLKKNGFPTMRESIKKFGDTAESVLNKVANGIKNLSNLGDVFSRLGKTFAKTGATKALSKAFQNVGKAVQHIITSLESTGVFDQIVKALGNIVKAASNAISEIAKFVSGLSPEQIKGTLARLVGLKVGFTAFKFLKSFNPFKFFKKNAKKGTDDAVKACADSKSKIAQVIESIGTLFKSVGQGISTAAKGIGTGISSAFRGIGQALKIANPVNILALGAAIGIVVASMTLLATQGSGVAEIISSFGTAVGNCAPFVTALGQAISDIVGTAITALANALLILSPVLPTIAASFAALSPLVTALGVAFSSIITAIGGAVSQIVTALAPVVQTIGDVFTQCVQIVANAIVQIVEALAPFIPNIQAIVESVSAAVQSIAEVFTTLLSQISPIIDSLSELVTNLGTVISDVFQGISEVVTSVGDAISGVLDSVAGIFDSIGEAALNAGKGFKKLAEGVEKLTKLSLLDMAASLGAVATGIGAITAVSGGMAEAGTGIQAIGTGLTLIAASAMVAVSGMNAIGTAIQPFITSVTTLSSSLPQAATSMLGFATGVMTAAASISASAAGILVMAAGVSVLASSSERAASAISGIGNALSGIAGAFQGVASGAQSAIASMQGMVPVSASVRSSLAEIASAGQQAMTKLQTTLTTAMNQAKVAGKGIGNGVLNGAKPGLMQLPVISSNAVNSTLSVLRGAASGAYSCGYYIGIGLANGMRSTLGTVQAVAAQLARAAEQAVIAKAKIGSPSRVFRKLGAFIGEGFAIGIESMERNVEQVSARMVSIPNTPALVGAGMNGYSVPKAEFRSEYSYTPVIYVNAEVTSVMDGREVGYGTARYVQEKNDNDAKVRKYITGKR